MIIHHLSIYVYYWNKEFTLSEYILILLLLYPPIRGLVNMRLLAPHVDYMSHVFPTCIYIQTYSLLTKYLFNLIFLFFLHFLQFDGLAKPTRVILLYLLKIVMFIIFQKPSYRNELDRNLEEGDFIILSSSPVECRKGFLAKILPDDVVEWKF